MQLTYKFAFADIWYGIADMKIYTL